MFDLLSSLPLAPAGISSSTLSPEIFALATHPVLPIYSIGLLSGHVQTFRLPSPTGSPTKPSTTKSSELLSAAPSSSVISNKSSSNGNDSQLRRSSLTKTEHSGGVVETLWKTRRHKGSCRALAFTLDGEHLLSAGTDGIVKIAKTDTGRVVVKIGVPRIRGKIDAPTAASFLSRDKFALSTDSGLLHIYILQPKPYPAASGFSSELLFNKPVKTYKPHTASSVDDSSVSFISSILPLPLSSTSKSNHVKQLLTTGGADISITDIFANRAVFNSTIAAADDFSYGEDVLSSVLIPFPELKTDVVVVGTGHCALTFFERGKWATPLLAKHTLLWMKDDGDTIDALCLLPETLGRSDGRSRLLACGDGTGNISIVTVELVPDGAKKIKLSMEQFRDHDREQVDGVTGLGYVNDPESGSGRLISVGGGHVRIWGKRDLGDAGGGLEDASLDSDVIESDADHSATIDLDDDLEASLNGIALKKEVEQKTKRGRAEAVESGEDDEADAESEEDAIEKPKKKRRKGKGKKGGMGNGSGLSVKLKGL